MKTSASMHAGQYVSASEVCPMRQKESIYLIGLSAAVKLCFLCARGQNSYKTCSESIYLSS